MAAPGSLGKLEDQTVAPPAVVGPPLTFLEEANPRSLRQSEVLSGLIGAENLTIIHLEPAFAFLRDALRSPPPETHHIADGRSSSAVGTNSDHRGASG